VRAAKMPREPVTSGMNEDWHATHVLGMGEVEQRVKWHVEHAQVCDCNQMPSHIAAEAHRRGLI
jgi:hypothetical protein